MVAGIAAGKAAPPGALGVETLVPLRRARDLIDSRYAEPLDLGAIAGAAGYSRYHFARAFRAAYGETPGRYLSRRRVERAQELLRSVNLTVTEVCFLVGFNSLGSFSSRFTELVGVSPLRYQRDALRAGPAPIPGCYAMMWGTPVGDRRGPHGKPETASMEKPARDARG